MARASTQRKRARPNEGFDYMADPVNPVDVVGADPNTEEPSQYISGSHSPHLGLVLLLPNSQVI